MTKSRSLKVQTLEDRGRAGSERTEVASRRGNSLWEGEGASATQPPSPRSPHVLVHFD